MKKKQLKVIIEHCAEPQCPACHKVAYETGYKAGRKSVIDEWKEDEKRFLQGFGFKKKK